jgi:hypothetical protein
MPGGSKDLGNGQCYDTHLGVTYSCSGTSQPHNPSQPGQPQIPAQPGQPQIQIGEKDPFVRLGPGPGSSQNPRGAPKTFSDIVNNVRDGFLSLWIPAFVESSKGYVKAVDETVAPEAKCVSEFYPISKVGKGLEWIDKAQLTIEVIGTEGWINKAKEAVPGITCLELTFDFRHWNKRFTQLMSYTKCLEANGPFTCLWIEADKSSSH